MDYYKISQLLVTKEFIKDGKELLPHLYPLSNDYIFSAYTYNKLTEAATSLFNLIKQHAQKHQLSDDEKDEIQERFHISLESNLQDPLSPELTNEIKLMLYSKKEMHLEYLGRNLNVLSKDATEKIKKENKIHVFKNDLIFAYDIYKGKRFYHFKVHLNSNLKLSISEDVKVRFKHLHNWFKEKDTKIILALGSGGCRMFAIPTVLKLIDELGPRDSIDEIWGCSGGSIIANLYSKGISPSAMEQIGYDFYSERYPDFFSKKSRIKTLLHLAKNISKNPKEFLSLTSGMAEIYDTFKLAYQKSLCKTPAGIKEIPYYSISTNLHNDQPLALTEGKNIKPYLRDYLIPCDPVQSMCASAAIPFIFPSELISGISGKWVDGMFVEEIPLVLPLLKFYLDKENDKNFPYKKLKLFYVDLGTRLEEISMFRYFAEHEKLFGKMALFGNIIDRLLNSKLNIPKEIISILPNVEMLGVRLKIGKMAIFDSGEIPYIIQKGRESMVSEFDKIELHLEKTKK